MTLEKTNQQLRLIVVVLDKIADILLDFSINYYTKSCNEAKGDNMIDPGGVDYD